MGLSSRHTKFLEIVTPLSHQDDSTLNHLKKELEIIWELSKKLEGINRKANHSVSQSTDK